MKTIFGYILFTIGMLLFEPCMIIGFIFMAYGMSLIIEGNHGKK